MEESVASLREQRYNSTVSDRISIHSDLMILRIKPDFPLPAYQAGQFCALGLGYWEPRLEGCQDEELEPKFLNKVVRRSYSISSSIIDENGHLRDMERDKWIEYYIVLVRENKEGRTPALTPRLFMLQPGDRLIMGQNIVGHYTTQHVHPDDTVIFLGTGTGEAPHNSMICELLKKNHRGRIVHVNCVRYAIDIGYRAIHNHLMELHPNYRYVALTTREQNMPSKVYIQDLITQGHIEDHLDGPLQPDSTHVFLCGNPAMIGVPSKDPDSGVWAYPKPKGVIELLEERGFVPDNPRLKQAGNIHYETYW